MLNLNKKFILSLSTIFTIFILLIIISSLKSYARVYRWVDDKGIVHYSNTPVINKKERVQPVDKEKKTEIKEKDEEEAESEELKISPEEEKRFIDEWLAEEKTSPNLEKLIESNALDSLSDEEFTLYLIKKGINDPNKLRRLHRKRAFLLYEDKFNNRKEAWNYYINNNLNGNDDFHPEILFRNVHFKMANTIRETLLELGDILNEIKKYPLDRDHLDEEKDRIEKLLEPLYDIDYGIRKGFLYPYQKAVNQCIFLGYKLTAAIDTLMALQNYEGECENIISCLTSSLRSLFIKEQKEIVNIIRSISLDSSISRSLTENWALKEDTESPICSSTIPPQCEPYEKWRKKVMDKFSNIMRYLRNISKLNLYLPE